MTLPADPTTAAGLPAVGGRRPLPLSALVVVQVLALAFILASFPVRNADFWSHLAVGRTISDGAYRFGVDPLAYTTAGIYWANTAWLFDFLLYHAFTALGDGVVLLKATFVVCLAGVLLLGRRPGSGAVVPALMTALVLLAMAPRLMLQPGLVSAGLLAVTTVILLGRGGKAAIYALPFVMALWVNLDGWFILGPIAVGLVWLAERFGTPAADRRVPTWLLPAVLVACAASPHHIRAFALPAEVSPAVLNGPLRDDPRFHRFFESAWEWRRYAEPSEGLNGGGIAYLALMVVGLASFGLNGSLRRRSRFALWIAFALLGVWNVRLAPFFAVVAGPVTALNIQDYWATRVARPRAWRSPEWLRVLGLATGGLVGAAFLALCWAGWVQSPTSDARRVGWAVQPDPGLREAAETRAAWRKAGLLGPDDRVFHVHPDSAAYAAWFAPGERCFLDGRLDLFTHVAAEYRDVCRAMGVAGGPATTMFWEAGKALRARQVTVLVLHDPDSGRLDAGYFRLAPRGAGTTLLMISGREATFGWGVGNGRPFANWSLDPSTAGFRPPATDARLPAELPADGSPSEVVPRTGWSRLLDAWADPLRAVPPRPAGGESAALYLRAFQDEVRSSGQNNDPVLPVSLAAALAVGTSAPPGIAGWGVVDALIGIDYLDIVFGPSGLAAPSAAVLAIRSARAATTAAPSDPLASLRLGQAYVALSYSTREREWAEECRPLAQLRHIQAAYSLERAVTLDPDLLEAHALLVQIYAARGFLDAALVHLREQERVARGRRKKPGSEEKVSLAEQLASLESAVQSRRNEFAIRAPGLAVNPTGRARAALSLGLAKTALDEVLLASEVVQFGTDGARLELELMLMLGRAGRAREELALEEVQDQRGRLGAFELPGPRRADMPPVYRLPAYEWARFLAAAADGRYDAAEAALAAIDAGFADRAVSRAEASTRGAAGLTVVGLGLAARPETWPVGILIASERDGLLTARGARRGDIQIRADIQVLASLLAVERGAILLAEGHLKTALRLADDPAARGAGFALEPLCRDYLRRIAAARPRE